MLCRSNFDPPFAAILLENQLGVAIPRVAGPGADGPQVYPQNLWINLRAMLPVISASHLP
jgi:hypothetical protein